MSRTKERIYSDIAIPPGKILLDTIKALSISQTELARRMDRPIQAINEIIKGKKEITADTAVQLEDVLGTPAHIWLNLERDYQLNKARLEEIEKLRKQTKKLDDFPIGAIAKLGWIKKHPDKLDQVKELLSFFGVASLAAIKDPRRVAFHKSSLRNASPGAIAAWLRKGEIEAAATETEPFNEKKLRNSINEIRSLNQQAPKEFEPRLKHVLAQCGVALVFVPYLPNSYVSGATYWLNPKKAVIQLSFRFKSNDQFWFSLFHEVGHILLHGKKDLFLDDWATDDEYEREASAFSANILIDETTYRKFLETSQRMTREVIIDFAERMDIAPGIVIGRLQHDGRLRHESTLNKLKVKYEW